MALEKRDQDVLLVPSRGGEAKIGLPKLGPFIASPLAMVPGSHDQGVLDVGILLLDGRIGCQRSVEILGVVPPSDGQDSRVDVLQVRKDVAGLPELVVVRMLLKIVPESDLVFEVF